MKVNGSLCPMSTHNEGIHAQQMEEVDYRQPCQTNGGRPLSLSCADAQRFGESQHTAGQKAARVRTMMLTGLFHPFDQDSGHADSRPPSRFDVELMRT